MFPVTIGVDQETREFLSRPVNGQGGFQDLLRELNRNLDGSSLVISSQSVAERIVRYSEEYNEGGFQNRLKTLADQVKPLL